MKQVYVNKKISFDYCPEFKIVSKASDLSQVFNLRHIVEVEEFGDAKSHSFHPSRQVKDKYDPKAIHIVSHVNNRIVAAIRMNFLNQLSFTDQEHYDSRRFPRLNVAVFSHLVVRRDFRKSGVFKRLVKNAYAVSLLNNCDIALAMVPENLVGLFARYGFITYKEKHVDDGVSVVPMYLELANEEYMREINSPLLEIFKNFKKPQESS